MVLAQVNLGCRASTAKVQDVHLARDEAGAEATTTFAPTDVVYLVGELANSPFESTLKSVWTSVDDGVLDAAIQVVAEKEIPAADGHFSFDLSHDRGLPVGTYQVDLSLDGELQETRTFQVVALAVAATATPGREGARLAGLLGDAAPAAAGAAYTYTVATDDSGLIRVELPAAWSDVSGAAFDWSDEIRAPSLTAAPDRAAFDAAYDVSGEILIALTSEEPVETVLDQIASDEVKAACTVGGRGPYDDGLFKGAFQLYTACGGSDTAILTLAARAGQDPRLALLLVQATSQADVDAAAHVLNTFTWAKP
jgi:hypothetical protein